MITKIWERLYVGSSKAAERLAAGNPLGITAVVTLSLDPIRSRNSKISYIQIPMPDGAVEPPLLESVINAISTHVRRGKLLLHCTAGFSRSPCMAAMWMDIVGYRSFDEALNEIARLRCVTDPSPALIKSVKEYLQAMNQPRGFPCTPQLPSIGGES
jgi:protein-tyrosine phosphatase